MKNLNDYVQIASRRTGLSGPVFSSEESSLGRLRPANPQRGLVR